MAGLEAALAEYSPAVIKGGTPADRRQAAVDAFQSDPKCRVFLGQNTAAGTAITLTAASEVWLVEPSWVPADNQQAAMRCHRIGQTDSVLVRFCALSGSMDENIAEALRRKVKTLTELFR